MSLGTNLAADIQAFFDAPPSSSTQAAEMFAQAYYDYASPCVFGASVPLNITTAMRDAMAATIAAALSANIFATAAAAFTAGLSAFWTGAINVAGGSGSGPVNGCPGASAVPAGLLVIAATFPVTTAIAAAGFAAVIETATLTVTATLTLPPGGPVVVPIS